MGSELVHSTAQITGGAHVNTSTLATENLGQLVSHKNSKTGYMLVSLFSSE